MCIYTYVNCISVEFCYLLHDIYIYKYFVGVRHEHSLHSRKKQVSSEEVRFEIMLLKLLYMQYKHGNVHLHNVK